MGGIRDTINDYLKVNTGLEGAVSFSDESQKHYDDLKFRSIKILNKDMVATPIIDMNNNFIVEIEYELIKPINSVQMVFELLNSVGACIFSTTD